MLKHLFGWILFCLVILLQSCGNYAKDAQLQSWLKETENENKRLTSLYVNQSKTQSWQLKVEGEIGQAPVQIDWLDLNKMATDHLRQRADGNQREQLVTSRGILVSHLLSSWTKLIIQINSGND